MKKTINNYVIERKHFLTSSGLDEGDMEINNINDRPDYLSIIYRNPITHDRFTTPDGNLFKRYKLLKPTYDDDGKLIKYRTCKGGGVHLYFPDSKTKGNVINYLQSNTNLPVYITEGEKKAAKAWKEGIPCIGLAGIWGWLANKQDRLNSDDILNPDFEFIPHLSNRTVVMIYDSDAYETDKKGIFENCSCRFKKSLKDNGVIRYEKIILPSSSGKKVGLDDYLLKNTKENFMQLVAQQSQTVSFDQYIMISQDFLSSKFPRIRYVLEPWLSDNGLTMIHAPAGVGKTYFLLGLSAAITRKHRPENFCGWKIKHRAGVLFVDGEMASFDMQKRLAKIEAAYPDNPVSKEHALSLLSCTHFLRQTGKRIDFSDENWRNEFSRIVANHPAKIIILDNIVSLMSTKDENDAGAWSVINQWLLSLRAMGKSVIIVHHSSNNGKQRGTSHRIDNLDTVIKLCNNKNADDGITVKFEKHRNFGNEQATPVNIDFKINENRAAFTKSNSLDVNIEKRDRLIFKMHKKGRSYERIIKKIKMKTGQTLTKGRISQIIKSMEKMGKPKN